MKILYIMGVEWDWIYQRPHVLAELLQDNHNVTVVCPKQLYHLGRKSNNKRPSELVELVQIPFQEKIPLIGIIADFFHKKKIGDVTRYDLIWVGYPLYVRYIPEQYRGRVIYDCMDNYEALFCDRSSRGIERLVGFENRIINRADVIFASAQKLADKIKMIRADANVQIVRNAYSKIDVVEPKQVIKRERYSIAYVGTVSEWFDNQVIQYSLDKCADIEYTIIGPLAKYEQIVDERVHYVGPKRHEELTECIKNVDCLIMPFILNDVILYVDPVKLYEYIAWGKCIVAPYYPEIERFGDFVYFYNSQEEYCSIISKLAMEGFEPKYSMSEQRQFLATSTWKERVKLIECELEKLVYN